MIPLTLLFSAFLKIFLTGSNGDCWADHYGHEEGGTHWREVSEKDLDGWFQGSHRQGVLLTTHKDTCTNAGILNVVRVLYSLWFVTESSCPNPQGRDHLTHEKERFAQEHPQMQRLEDVVRELKPTAIIGKAALTFLEDIWFAMFQDDN